MKTETLNERAERYIATECIGRGEWTELVRELLAMAKRYQWARPILTGSDDKLADSRALALAMALTRGLDGDAAIDSAMNTTKVSDD